MKVKIRNTKILMYLILVAATAVFAYISMILYFDDLEDKVTPQVNRAMVQVSQILPQLQENEEALREVNANLEKSRKTVYNNNGDAISRKAHGEDVETVIDNTLSWMNRVTGLRVGREGHVVVVSAEDFSILAHPDERFIGEGIYPVDEGIETDDIPDISELDPDIIENGTSDNFHLFVPESMYELKEKYGITLDLLDAGILGSVFSYRDTFIICGVTLSEVLSYVIARCIITTLIFLAVVWVFVRYAGFCLTWHKDEKKAFRRKILSYAAVATVLMFGVTWYYQTMQNMTGDIATMNEHAQVAVETLNTYKEYREELSDWLDDQYLEQCRLAAQLVLSKGRDNVTRADLAEYADELGVKYIYVFDKKGKVKVTNSPYDHFVLSKDEKDQSYAFRPLLDGREYVIQGVQKDESAGEELQYIGVSIRDENDLADGFVQIAVDPTLRNRLLAPINVQTVLDNLVIGLPEYALAIKKDNMEIAATTGLGYKKTNISDLGISEDKIRNDFNGIFIINGFTYYGGVSESEDMYLMPICRASDNASSKVLSAKLMLYCAGIFLLICLICMLGYNKVLLVRETEEAQKAEAVDEIDDESEEDEERGIIRKLKGMIKVQEKLGFEDRWKKQSSVPIEEQTPEMRAGGIIYRILLAFSTLVVAFEVLVINYIGTDGNLDGFSYVLLGNWEPGVNLFSFSYCLYLICVLYVFQELINQILYRVAKISDLRKETIFLLIRNALKYGCALAFLYVGLAKFGVDTKTLWASAGVLSLMIGFGAKDLVNDIIAGIFIIFEGTFKIGDFIIVGDWSGMVEEIGIRSTKVSYFSETKIFNNSSLRDIINCDGDVAREVVKFPISYETDIREVEKLLIAELPRMAENVPGLVKPPKYDGLSSLDESCVTLRIKMFTVPFRRKKAVRALLREIKILFDEHGVNIPYNHLVVMDYEKETNTFTYEPEEENTTDDETEQ